MEDLLEPSPGNKFSALWTVSCNYSTVALVLINAWNTFNVLCYLLWVPPCKWERSAVLPGGGDWNLRAELRQCRKQRAQVSSVTVAILCSICIRLASAALPRILCTPFSICTSRSLKGAWSLQIQTAEVFSVVYAVCCTKSGRASACY